MSRDKRDYHARRQSGSFVVSLVILLAVAAFVLFGPTIVSRLRAAFGSGSTGIETTTDGDSGYTYTEWDPDAYPDYYRVVGPAVVDTEIDEGTISYSDLDYLGRAGRVVGNITYEMMIEGSESERPDMSDLHPSGWGHNAEVTITMPDGDDYKGKLFNRSHLLAKSLGGAAIIENLVCGTRTQNVGDNEGEDGGMAYTEGLAREWLYHNHDGTVYYSATPVYEGDDLVCRSVIVDVKSSDGDLDLRVEVYNTALGFTIDYATGEWEET